VKPSSASPAGPVADDLRRTLDRAVWLARGGRLLAACGGWIVAGCLVVAAAAMIDLLSQGRLGIASLPRGTKLAVMLAVAAAPAAVAFRQRLARDGWPDRLGIALATEARHPHLGESLSRAVDFLAHEPAPAERHATGRGETFRSKPVTARALEQMSVELAAAAARDAGGPAVPGLLADAAWGVAGAMAPLVLLASLTFAPAGWADAVGRQLAAATETRRTTEQPVAPTAAAAAASPAVAALPPEAMAAAAQVAAAAALERRLAELLADHFERAPGVPAEALPRAERRTVDDLAAIQGACLKTIAAAREAIRSAAESIDESSGSAVAVAAAATSPRDRLLAALVRLTACDLDAAEASPATISANRLHSASEAAARLAAGLAEIAAELGAAPATREGAALAAARDGRDDTGMTGPLAAAAATLQRIASEPAGHVQVSRDVVADRPGTATGPSASQAPASARGLDESGPDTAAATTDPRGGSQPAVAETAVGAADAVPIERVWSLLPETGRSQSGHRAVESAPPAYRSAIDAYYRLLLQSLPDRPAAPAP
jgi:hypothetical protein